MEPSVPRLVGRSVELSRIASVVDGSGLDQAALLVEGDAGIGKTALVEFADRRSRQAGHRRLVSRGVRGGGSTGYAGLHELLHPVLEQVDDLPPRQRSALRIAFGEEEGQPSDRLLISLATLGLLEEVAQAGPVVLFVEDLHWIDTSSAEIIAFLARRLGNAPIRLLATTRTGGAYRSWSDYFPDVIRLAPLTAGESAQLLDDLAPDLGTRLRERLLHGAEGNPLAVRELWSAVTADHLPESALLQEQLPITRRLEQAFLAEAEALPSGSRQVLLVAAAGEDLTVEELLAANRELGLTTNDLHLAEQAGLLGTDGGRARFRHPLVSSSVYGAAPVGSKVAVHRALAQVARDPGRAARHRAAATIGWDEEVAAELAEAAAVSARQGARAEATAAWRQAAALSPGALERLDRLAHAAESARQAGMTSDALDLLSEALPLTEQHPGSVQGLARTEWMLSMTAGSPGRTATELVTLAGQLLVDPLEMLVWAATKCYIMAEPEPVRRVVRTALEGTAPGSTLREIGLALVDPGRGLAGIGVEALQELGADLSEASSVILNCLAFTAEQVLDLPASNAFWTSGAELFHRSARLSDECTAICGRGTIRVMAADLLEGQADAEYAWRLSRDLDLPVVTAMAAADAARAAAWTGDHEHAREALDYVEKTRSAEAFARVQASAAWAAGIIALNEGRFAVAIEELQRTGVHPPIALWAGADLVEAAVRADRPDVTDEWLTQADAALAQNPSDHLSMLVLRSRALMTGSEDGFRAALEHGSRAGVTLEVARTKAHFAEWLRRRRRIAEARTLLEDALTVFTAVGARPWADRVAAELGAAGAPVPVQAGPGDPRRTLTAQELQVARLAARGLSNKEIADQIYLSHRTVATHLHNLFPKLGISQRGELSTALGETLAVI